MNKKNGIRTFTKIMMTSLLAGVSSAAQAQAVAEETDPGEIIVTATKRAENLQSIPISVSAITGDTLSKSLSLIHI